MILVLFWVSCFSILEILFNLNLFLIEFWFGILLLLRVLIGCILSLCWMIFWMMVCCVMIVKYVVRLFFFWNFFRMLKLLVIKMRNIFLVRFFWFCVVKLRFFVFFVWLMICKMSFRKWLMNFCYVLGVFEIYCWRRMWLNFDNVMGYLIWY